MSANDHIYLIIIAAALLVWLAYGACKRRRKAVPCGSHPIDIGTTTPRCTSQEYSIRGINFCEMDDSLLGDFTGTAHASTSNPHDPYAIELRRDGRLIGYLPRGNRPLHGQITAAGGSIAVEGHIGKATDADGRSFYYGKVWPIGV